MILPSSSKATFTVPKQERKTATGGGTGPSVCSTACLMTTVRTGTTRAMSETEVKCAGLAGEGQAVLIGNRTKYEGFRCSDINLVAMFDISCCLAFFNVPFRDFLKSYYIHCIFNFLAFY